MRFTQFERAYPQARMTEYAVSVSAGADPRAVRSHIERALADAGVPVAAAIDCDSVRATRTMVSRLIILILVVFAVLVTIISLALCTFHIRNIVETDRTDMGVLKALGYTGQMISHAMMAPYLLVCVGATLAGLALSTLATPAIGSLIALQAGFTFHARADARAWLITIAALAGVTLLFAWIGVRSLRALQPIEAIRGISARSQRHTVRPLNRMPGNARTAISLQQAAASPSRNLLVGCMTFLMTLIVKIDAAIQKAPTIIPAISHLFFRSISCPYPSLCFFCFFKYNVPMLMIHILYDYCNFHNLLPKKLLILYRENPPEPLLFSLLFLFSSLTPCSLISCMFC